MSEFSLGFHPEYLALAEETARLREELTHLLTDEHDLLHVTKPNLLASYQQKIGAWEVQCMNAQIEAAWARGRWEMAQAALNQGGAPDWAKIESHLELEFRAWQHELREATTTLEAAEQRLAGRFSPAEEKELKRLYYALVKKLHPDVNPEVSEDRRRLWLRVQAAYESTDLEELQALTVLADRAVSTEPSPAALETLRRAQESLRKHIAEMERRIELIQNEPPFLLREQLADEEWVSGRRKEIEARAAQYEAHRSALDTALKASLKMPEQGEKQPPAEPIPEGEIIATVLRQLREDAQAHSGEFQHLPDTDGDRPFEGGS